MQNLVITGLILAFGFTVGTYYFAPDSGLATALKEIADRGVSILNSLRDSM